MFEAESVLCLMAMIIGLFWGTIFDLKLARANNMVSKTVLYSAISQDTDSVFYAISNK